MKKVTALVLLRSALGFGVTFVVIAPAAWAMADAATDAGVGSTAMPEMVANPANLRQQAARLFHLAMATRDVALSQKLKLKAAESFNQMEELQCQQVTTKLPAAN